MDDSFYAPYRKAFGFMVGNGTGGNTPGEALIEAEYSLSWKVGLTLLDNFHPENVYANLLKKSYFYLTVKDDRRSNKSEGQ